MATFFTADLHLGHRNILKHCQRPGLSYDEASWLAAGQNFDVSAESVQRMDDLLIDNINRVVTERDELWILGDFCVVGKDRYAAAARAYRDRIRCRTVHLLWGNHDLPELSVIFNSHHQLVRIRIDHQKIVLCHYALAVWQGSQRGTWHLYGHSHGNAEDWLNNNMPGRCALDVGVDNAAELLGEYRPWSFTELRAYMQDRPGYWFDHHNRSGDDL